FCNLVAVGEQSGTLDNLLEKIAAYKEQMESIRKKIKKALFYPITIITIAMGVVLVMLMFVIPQFEILFHSFGKQLPTFTRIVVSASNTIRRYWWLFFMCGLAIIFGFIYIKNHVKAFAYFIDKIKLKIFIFGPLFKKAIIARVTRTLSIALAAGVPLVDSLGSIADVAGNMIYHDAIMHVRDEVAAGQPLDLSMQETHLFPNLVIKMIIVGEQSGKLEEVLSKVATFYEEDIERAVDMLSSLIEPLVMVILGIIIGGFVAAMYLPIFKLGTIF
ncbi:MAG: type II secretion system F family protein, partial [Candidatus Neomarinimicrobiota bacterium]